MIRLSVIVCWMIPNLSPAHGAENKRLEITESDVFVDPDWTSASVSVAGFALRETRAQVLKSASDAGYRTFCDDSAATSSRDSCSVTINEKSSYGGLDVEFGPDDEVSAIHIYSDYFLCEAQDCIAKHIRGPLGRLLSNYSDHDRVRLLGPATLERRLNARKGELVEYNYDKRGITLSAQRKIAEANADHGKAIVALTLSPVKP